jgi:hypothetical protein
MIGYCRAVGAVALALLLTAPNVPAAAQQPAFQPGMGDLMTAFVQPRHAKLGLAGHEQNWAYAAYAAHELEEALEGVAKAVPKFREFSIPDLMASSVQQPLEAVERAIKAGDPAAFATGYEQLTAACNACHQSTGHGVIVIRVPTVSAFPNQDFRPPTK